MKLAALLVLLVFAQIAVAQQEATSLLGKPLLRPKLDDKTLADFEAKLEKARADFTKNPDDVDTIVWFGRRTAYLGRYRDAIDIYSKGLETHPDNPKLYRHRGHRFLSIREIDKAIVDFEKAARLIQGKEDEVEPDGLPNAKNIPTSTLHTNIYYHLGLAHYLKGDFQKAEAAYRDCMKFTKNDDMLVAVTHWMYMTLRRQGKEKEASAVLVPIRSEMNVIEDFEYHALCLLYKGEKKPDELLKPAETALAGATLSYGVGNWFYYNGQKERAREIFNQIVATKEWGAFGYLAAEAELARWKDR